MQMGKQVTEPEFIWKFLLNFFAEKIELTGHKHDDSEICVGMIFLPRNNYEAQENARTLS